MKTLTIKKPNKSKTQLLLLLESQLIELKGIIKENNAQVERIDDGFSLNIQKSVLFMKFYIKATIIAEEESFLIEYGTNVPESKIEEFRSKIIGHLKNL